MSLKDEIIKAQEEKNQQQKSIPRSDSTNKKRTLDIGDGVKSTYERTTVGRAVNEGADINIRVNEESKTD